MIEFRQKDFGKVRDAFKKAGEDPIKTALGATGTVLGVANLSLNLSRRKKDTELRQEQIKAIDNLTKALEETKSSEVKKSSKKLRTSFRKKHPEDINEDHYIILPNPVSIIKDKI